MHRTSGRVFRFAVGSPPRQPQVDLRQLNGQQLAALHAHPNQWHVRQARLILAEHAGRPEAPDSVTAVTQAQQRLMLQLSGDDACLALNSLCTLYCMGVISPDELLPLLNHPPNICACGPFACCWTSIPSMISLAAAWIVDRWTITGWRG